MKTTILALIASICLPACLWAEVTAEQKDDFNKCLALQVAADQDVSVSSDVTRCEAVIQAWTEHLRKYPWDNGASPHLAHIYNFAGQPRRALQCWQIRSRGCGRIPGLGTRKATKRNSELKRRGLTRKLSDYASALQEWEHVRELKPERQSAAHVESLRRALKEGEHWRQWLVTNRGARGCALGSKQFGRFFLGVGPRRRDKFTCSFH